MRRGIAAISDVGQPFRHALTTQLMLQATGDYEGTKALFE